MYFSYGTEPNLSLSGCALQLSRMCNLPINRLRRTYNHLRGTSGVDIFADLLSVFRDGLASVL